jgi:GOST, seven transmembrane domain
VATRQRRRSPVQICQRRRRFDSQSKKWKKKKMMKILLVLVFVLLPMLTCGERMEIANLTLQEDHHYGEAQALWVAGESPRWPNYDKSGGTLRVDLTLHTYSSPARRGHMELLIFHNDDYDAIGHRVGAIRYICCSIKLRHARVCDELGTVLIQAAPRRVASFHRELVQFTSGESVMRKSIEVRPESSGVHWFYAVNCLDGGAGIVRMGGEMVMTNPYGMLAADSWGALPFYAVQCSLLAVACALWAFACARRIWRRREGNGAQLYRAQYALGACLALGLLQSVLYYMYYSGANQSADGASAVLVLAPPLVDAVFRGAARLMLLVHGSGYQTMRAELGAPRFVGGALLMTVLYIGVSALSLSASLSDAAADSSDAVGLVFSVTAPAVMLDFLYYGWIVLAHITTTRDLEIGHRAHITARYRSFLYALVGIAVVSIFMVVYQATSAWRVAAYVFMWPFWWLWPVWWTALFVILLLTFAFLWSPFSVSIDQDGALDDYAHVGEQLDDQAQDDQVDNQVDDTVDDQVDDQVDDDDDDSPLYI